jgi:hypothetical protein
VSAALKRGPLVTLVTAALVGAGLLTANALTDPARTRAEVPASAATTAAAVPAAATTPTTAPPSSTTTASVSATTTTTAVTTTAAAAYPAEAVYVGRDANRRISVAVAVRDGKAAAYVCDGKSLESWLTGTVSGDTATLSSGSDRLLAEHDAGWLDVTGTVRGRALYIRAKLASEPAGLYRLSATDGTTIGWIISVDGQAAYPNEVSGDDRF